MKQLSLCIIICLVFLLSCDFGSPGNKTSVVDSLGDSVRPSNPSLSAISSVDLWNIAQTEQLKTDGDDQTIIVIETWRDLEYVSRNAPKNTELLNYTYKMTNDIVFPEFDVEHSSEYKELYVKEAGFMPIGTKDLPFTGTLDGNGFAIINLYINRPSDDYIGLFGSVDGAILKNIHMNDVDVRGRSYIGALVGKIHGTETIITNSHIQGMIEAEEGYVGGLVGFIAGSNNLISNSRVRGFVTGESNSTGGLVGRIGGKNNSVANSQTTNSVSGTKDVGGLVGSLEAEHNPIMNISTHGTVIGDVAVGGCIGSVRGTKHKFFNIHAEGHVIGTKDMIGGLIGSILGEKLSIIKGRAHGNVSGTNNVGGLIGYMNNDNSVVSKNYADGDVSGNDHVGGLIGNISIGDGISITNNYAVNTVSAIDGPVGGLVGRLSGKNVTIAQSYANSAVSGENVTPTNIGGFIGEVSNALYTFTENYWNKDIQSIDELSGIGTLPNSYGVIPLISEIPSSEESDLGVLQLTPERFSHWNSGIWTISRQDAIWPTLLW